MTYQYFSLSNKANLDENESIWIVNSTCIKIPDGQLEKLFSLFSRFKNHEAEILQKVFVDFEEEFEVEIEDEYYIEASAEIKIQWIEYLDSLLDFILNAKDNIYEHFTPLPDWYYDNDEYARIIKALIQIVRESIRLNQPINKWLAH